jgi:hypothetical protein
VQETGSGVDVVLTNTGYTAVFGKGNSVSGSGMALITAITIYSPDGKNLSEYDSNLVGYWDMETMNDIYLRDFSKNGNHITMIDTI